MTLPKILHLTDRIDTVMAIMKGSKDDREIVRKILREQAYTKNGR